MEKTEGLGHKPNKQGPKSRSTRVPTTYETKGREVNYELVTCPVSLAIHVAMEYLPIPQPHE